MFRAKDDLLYGDLYRIRALLLFSPSESSVLHCCEFDRRSAVVSSIAAYRLSIGVSLAFIISATSRLCPIFSYLPHH